MIVLVIILAIAVVALGYTVMYQRKNLRQERIRHEATRKAYERKEREAEEWRKLAIGIRSLLIDIKPKITALEAEANKIHDRTRSEAGDNLRLRQIRFELYGHYRNIYRGTIKQHGL